MHPRSRANWQLRLFWVGRWAHECRAGACQLIVDGRAGPAGAVPPLRRADPGRPRRQEPPFHPVAAHSVKKRIRFMALAAAASPGRSPPQAVPRQAPFPGGRVTCRAHRQAFTRVPRQRRSGLASARRQDVWWRTASARSRAAASGGASRRYWVGAARTIALIAAAFTAVLVAPRVVSRNGAQAPAMRSASAVAPRFGGRTRTTRAARSGRARTGGRG